MDAWFHTRIAKTLNRESIAAAARGTCTWWKCGKSRYALPASRRPRSSSMAKSSPGGRYEYCLVEETQHHTLDEEGDGEIELPGDDHGDLAGAEQGENPDGSVFHSDHLDVAESPPGRSPLDRRRIHLFGDVQPGIHAEAVRKTRDDLQVAGIPGGESVEKNFG